ncbi:MAG: hypothetical protein J07HR59_01752 [Halorubrum sp. J07HR59]|nr:MAG: hypothetical protein J07HR59_01752 [Halorubrum sp. J07HR59]
MKFIEEIVVEEFLPTVRSMLASELQEQGYTQLEIADALGVSQSAVSKYAHGAVAHNERIASDERVQEVVQTVADGLASGDLSQVAGLVEIEVLVRQLETGDTLAELHEEAMPALADADVDFTVHDPDSDLRQRERTLASVRRGIRMVTTSSGFAGLIPNVGSNIVESLPNATTIDDIAAIPGRLVDVKGQTMVPSEPEFGASQYVASVLLAARTADATLQGAVNLRYDEQLLDRLKEPCTTVEFAADSTAADSVVAALTDRDVEPPLALYQTGAVGVEPIVYVVASDAPEAVRIVRDLV